MSNESILESRKFYKRNKILNIIRYNENISRYDLKKITSYSMTTVLNITEELLKDKLIYEEDCNESRVGRKPFWLKINPVAGYFIGIELNLKTIHCAMLNFYGEVVFEYCIKNPKDICSEGIINDICSLIEMAVNKIKGEKVFGIGIGIPGYFDSATGVALEYPMIPSWKNIPIRQIIEDRFGLRCHIDNNVTVMAFAYKWLKSNDYLDDFIFISIRSGARIVPIINNELFLSNKCFAGQLGHIRMPNSNRLCTCGKRGCLNAEVSDSGIRGKIAEGALIGRFKQLMELIDNDISKIDISTFVESVKLNHKDSVELLYETASYLGYAIGLLCDIFAPQKIVLMGELVKTGDIFIDAVSKEVSKNAIADNYKNLKIYASTFSDNIGALGAAAMVMQREFEFIKENI
jgi:Transcriptional regulator/sugar kinase